MCMLSFPITTHYRKYACMHTYIYNTYIICISTHFWYMLAHCQHSSVSRCGAISFIFSILLEHNSQNILKISVVYILISIFHLQFYLSRSLPPLVIFVPVLWVLIIHSKDQFLALEIFVFKILLDSISFMSSVTFIMPLILWDVHLVHHEVYH